MRNSITLIIIILTGLYLQAQQPLGITLKGSFSDSLSCEPLGYVVVKLFQAGTQTPVTGTLGQDNGSFEISGIKPGVYRVEASFMGFRTWVKDSLKLMPMKPVVDIGKISLAPENSDKNTVEIEGEKDIVEYSFEKRIYNVGKDISITGSTVTDILQNVPSVTVDNDRQIQLRGNSNVTILIDGKPSGMTQNGGLDQIPANMIYRIEVITNPSAKYDAEGTGGIINIVTKKNMQDGISGTVNATVGSNDKYTGGFKLNFKSGKWNINTGINALHNIFWRENSQERKNIVSDTVFYLYSKTTGWDNTVSPNGNLSIDFQPSKNTSTGINLTGGIRDAMNTSGVAYTFFDENQIATSFPMRSNRTNTDGKNIDASFYLRHKLKNPEKEISFDASHSYNNTRDLLNGFYWDPALWFGYANAVSTERTYQTTMGQFNYTGSLRKWKLETGIKGTLRNMEGLRQFGETENAWDTAFTLDYQDQVLAGYGQLKGMMGKFGISLGVRVEYTSYNVATFDSTYSNLFPSLIINRTLKDVNTISFSYSKRINRPGPETLTPFPDLSDPFNLYGGNPYTQPEMIHSLELGFRGPIRKKYFVTPTAYFRYSENSITRYRSITPEGVSTINSANVKGAMNAGMEMSFSGEITKWWNFNASGNVFYRYVNAGNLAIGLSNTGVSGNIRIMSQFKPLKPMSLQVAYMQMFAFVAPQGRGNPGGQFDISTQYSLLKDKLSLSLRLTDIFDTRMFLIRSEDVSFVSTGMMKRETRILYFGASYRFGNAKPKDNLKKPTQEQPMDDGGGF